MSVVTSVVASDTPTLPRYRGGAEIHHRLIEGGRFDSDLLSIEYHVLCDALESLQTRLQRRDPTMGLIDPSRLVLNGGDARDVARVTIHGSENNEGYQSNTFDVFVYLAHLTTEKELLKHVFDDSDEESEDEKEGERTTSSDTALTGESPDPDPESLSTLFFTDGSFTGTLLWDAAVRLSEFVLRSETWREKLKNANVVELGCGVGLLGLVAFRCGCKTAALTDRKSLRSLCEDNIKSWREAMDLETLERIDGTASTSRCQDDNDASVPSNLFFTPLEWTDSSSATKLKHLMNNKIDVVFAADCVFGGLFGDAAPLVDALRLLSDENTIILIATERRPGDGLESFRDSIDVNFVREVVQVVGSDGNEPVHGVGDIVIEELRLR